MTRYVEPRAPQKFSVCCTSLLLRAITPVALVRSTTTRHLITISFVHGFTVVVSTINKTHNLSPLIGKRRALTGYHSFLDSRGAHGVLLGTLARIGPDPRPDVVHELDASVEVEAWARRQNKRRDGDGDGDGDRDGAEIEWRLSGDGMEMV